MKLKFAWLLPLLVIASACQPQVYSPTPAAIAEPAISSTTPFPTPTVEVCRENRGRFEYDVIQTSLMTHPLSFRVYLPPCYDFEFPKTYPVLYLLHGQSFNDDQWDRLGADETLDEMVTSGETMGFIIVMPKESNYLIDQRTSKFGPAIAEELVPWVEDHYRVCRNRKCRAIGGISRGAGWAMRIGLIYWDIFGSIGGHSLEPFRGDFNEAPFWFAKIPEDEKPRIWIDAGDRDFMTDPARVFTNRLEDYNMPFEWHVYPGSHNETYWRAHVADYLRWYAEGFSE